MRHTSPLLLSVLLLTLVGAPSVVRSAEWSTTPNELMAQFAKAWSNDNVEAVLAMLSEDVAFVRSGEVTRGIEAVAAWVREETKSTDVLTIKPVSSGVGGDLAYQMGRWAVTHEGGTATGSHTVIFRRGPNGEWRIVALEKEDDPEKESSPAS